MIITDLYQINGKALLAPDAGVEMSFQDLDASESGRDESGFMHRILLRPKVGVWNFCYSHLTREEYSYLLSVMPEGESFTFTYPDPTDPGCSLATTAYLSQYGVAWQNATTGQYRNLKFSIIEC